MEKVKISTKNGNKITLTLYGDNHENILIIASATGVKQEFYRNFAQYLAQQEYTVITFDYTGIGASLEKPIKEISINAASWGRNDLEAVIQYAQSTFANVRINFIGHSIGGQVLGLAKSNIVFNKIILIAAQSGYWKHWRGIDKMKMLFTWYLLFPVMIFTFGYMPSRKFSGMENLPLSVAKQWSKWGRNKKYLLDDVPQNDLYFEALQIPITSISIQNDFYAPKEAVDWLTNLYSNARVNRLHLHPKDYQNIEIGHFGIFKSKFKDSIWPFLVELIKK